MVYISDQWEFCVHSVRINRKYINYSSRRSLSSRPSNPQAPVLQAMAKAALIFSRSMVIYSDLHILITIDL